MAARRTTGYGIAAVAIALAIIGGALLTNPSLMTGTLTQLTSPSTSSSHSSTTTNPQGTSSQSATSGVLGPTGLFSFYLTDAPPSSSTLKYLLVNVTSIELRYSDNLSGSTPTSSSSTTQSTTTSTTSHAPSDVFVFNISPTIGTNVNITKLQGQSLLMGATKAPAGNVSSIVLNITGAKAFFKDGSSAQLKVVANGKLMVPVHFQVRANGSTDLTVDIQPNDIHISQGHSDVLTPVIHVTSVDKSDGSTTTSTTATTFSSVSQVSST